jgi:hypothetical protein
VDLARVHAAASTLEEASPSASSDHVVPRLGEVHWGCVVCSREASQPGGCCSASCASQAHLELDRNARTLRHLTATREAAEARRVAERNGRLSSALMRWRPQDADPAVRGDVTGSWYAMHGAAAPV